MHDTGTGVISYEIACNDSETAIVPLVCKVVKQGHILLLDKLLPLEGLLDLILFGLLVHLRQPALGQYEMGLMLFIIDLDIFEIGIDCQCQVGWQCPRRGCPSNELGVCIPH